jgi:hypothetical protein
MKISLSVFFFYVEQLVIEKLDSGWNFSNMKFSVLTFKLKLVLPLDLFWSKQGLVPRPRKRWLERSKPHAFRPMLFTLEQIGDCYNVGGLGIFNCY